MMRMKICKEKVKSRANCCGESRQQQSLFLQGGKKIFFTYYVARAARKDDTKIACRNLENNQFLETLCYGSSSREKCHKCKHFSRSKRAARGLL